MDVKDLRQFSAEELNVRVRQWRDELFRAKFKAESSEARDTSIFRKLRKNIARGETIMVEKRSTVSTADVEKTTLMERPKGKPAKAKSKSSKPKEVVANDK